MRPYSRLLFPVALLLAGCGSTATGAPSAEAIYEVCFKPDIESMVVPDKSAMYALLLTKNNFNTHGARDYVTGPFSQALEATPSPIDVAFQKASQEIASTYQISEAKDLIHACEVDHKTLSSLPPELKERTTSLVKKHQYAAMAEILERQQGELSRRLLQSPFQ
jgi:hypothetical protein